MVRWVSLALLLAAPSALAGKWTALTPTLKPEGAVELRTRFQDAVIRGLQQSGQETYQAAETRMRFGSIDELMSCTAAGCASRAASISGAEGVVTGEIEALGKDYTIKLRLFDATGREHNLVQEQCDICTVKEAEDAVVRAAQKLGGQGLRKATPVAKAAPVTKAEPVPVKKTEPVPVKKAEPTPPPPANNTNTSAAPATSTPSALTTNERPPSGKKPFPWRWVAIASVAAGALALIIGIPLLAVDGNIVPSSCLTPGVPGTCRELYDTKAGGGAMLAIGLGGLAASVPLFILDNRSRKRAGSVSLVPTGSGGMLVATGAF